ncbi:IS66 family transposase, partial [Ruminococcaceae bacterium OttesenSCG-928-I18]|nr:IS66 family transposase [Ruminococcaceae bacterium OttesenSCG-928-I18]
METVTIPREEYEELKALQPQVSELTRQVQWLMEQVRLAKHRQFGASSEKSGHTQLNLFNEAEQQADENIAEPELCEVEKHYRKKAREAKDRLPADLPVEVVEHTLPADEQICPECDSPLHVMGKRVRRELKLVPAKAVIVEHVQYVYACRECERDSCGVPILKAPVDEPVIKGSFASPEAVAHIMAQKFVMGVPLYRQERYWTRRGVMLSRQTMSNWLLRASRDWLEPIWDALHEVLLNREVLHGDETVLQVLHEEGKSAQSKSYMWLYRSGCDARAPIVLFDYQPDRTAKRPADFLQGFKGYLHTDGYAGYHALHADIVVVGCWAHARRKFHEALESMTPKDREGSLAQQGERFCDKLFAVERKAKDMTPQERHQFRQDQAKPVLGAFLAWLKVQNGGKTAFGKAVRYTLDNWPYLERYLLDGRLEISNNRAENSIRPFVVGRKNWLFANTPRGARASAIIYSIVETAKENGLDPYNYLCYL